MTLPSRDSVLWWIGMIGGACVALAGHFNQFPWIPVADQHAIELVGYLSTVVSAKLATSPLSGASK